ncbi:MAG: hypothetical protein AAFY71_01770 [Bacteroidota bacterium]
MKRLLLLITGLGIGLLSAQPETDIYLIKVSQEGDSYSLSQAKNITPRKGYDNQPFFMPDNQGILYVSADSKGQTDVYRYNIQSGTSTRLTETKKRSEYSPKVMPKGKHFSVVTVEEDNKQRLWYFPIEKNAFGKVLMPKIDSIGYYSWYGKKKLGMFILTDPFTLQKTHRKRQKPKVVDQSIGRTLIQQVQTDTLTYIRKESEGNWFIMAWHPSSGESKKLCPSLPFQEDFCWTPDGKVLMGDGEALYIRDPYKGTNWRKIGEPGIGKFYRVAMSQDGKYIALVAYQGDKP